LLELEHVDGDGERHQRHGAEQSQSQPPVRRLPGGPVPQPMGQGQGGQASDEQEPVAGGGSQRADVDHHAWWAVDRL
jgi:hypothetical protein